MVRIGIKKEITPTTDLERRLLEVVKEQHELLRQIHRQDLMRNVNRPGGIFIRQAIHNAKNVMYRYE